MYINQVRQRRNQYAFNSLGVVCQVGSPERDSSPQDVLEVIIERTFEPLPEKLNMGNMGLTMASGVSRWASKTPQEKEEATRWGYAEIGRRSGLALGGLVNSFITAMNTPTVIPINRGKFPKRKCRLIRSLQALQANTMEHKFQSSA